MCIKALPERLQTPEAWKGTDMDNWFQRWILKNPRIHGLLAYGPRDPHWWECWRTIPKVLFAIGGKGAWRWESDTNKTVADFDGFILRDRTLTKAGYYISRIQYWKRWHLAIHWPFLVTFHFYFKEEDVLVPQINQGSSVDRKLFYCYFGAHRDADQVYWFPSAFLGLTWK
jgi:hypothetical protein